MAFKMKGWSGWSPLKQNDKNKIIEDLDKTPDQTSEDQKLDQIDDFKRLMGVDGRKVWDERFKGKEQKDEYGDKIFLDAHGNRVSYYYRGLDNEQKEKEHGHLVNPTTGEKAWIEHHNQPFPYGDVEEKGSSRYWKKLKKDNPEQYLKETRERLERWPVIWEMDMLEEEKKLIKQQDEEKRRLNEIKKERSITESREI